MPDDANTKATPDNKDLLEQLSSEYKILQDKIDKIGAFRFTIRGWSITIVVASCVGATTARLPSPFLLLGLVVFVVVFGCMERVQTKHSEVFGRRCAEIERWIWRLLRDQGAHAPSMVPKIAHALADQTRADLHRWSPRIRPLVHFLKSEGENVFYVILIVVVLSLTVWLWLAGQPQRTENAESPQIIQYVVKGTETDASVQRSEKQKETKQNAPKKQTARD
jgi:hypothetical protein